jgi:membrane protein YqaA with SNARE-associated domain
MVILVTAGASLGSYAGGAAGFLLSCFVVHFIDNNPNP